MNTFKSLLSPLPGEMPADTQRRAAADFAATLSANFDGRVALREASDGIPSSGRFIVLGVATWSLHDLGLLDELTRELKSAAVDRARLAAFDVSACESAAELERFVPGAGAVDCTPVVGVYANGKLVSVAIGLPESIGALRQFLPLRDAA